MGGFAADAGKPSTFQPRTQEAQGSALRKLVPGCQIASQKGPLSHALRAVLFALRHDVQQRRVVVVRVHAEHTAFDPDDLQRNSPMLPRHPPATRVMPLIVICTIAALYLQWSVDLDVSGVVV